MEYLSTVLILLELSPLSVPFLSTVRNSFKDQILSPNSGKLETNSLENFTKQ